MHEASRTTPLLSAAKQSLWKRLLFEPASLAGLWHLHTATATEGPPSRQGSEPRPSENDRERMGFVSDPFALAGSLKLSFGQHLQERPAGRASAADHLSPKMRRGV